MPSAASARTLAATGAIGDAIGVLEATLDRVDPGKLPWLRATLQLQLARLREQVGDRAGATLDAKAAAAMLATLDVVLDPADAALLTNLDHAARPASSAGVAGPRREVVDRVVRWFHRSAAGHQGTPLSRGADRLRGR